MGSNRGYNSLDSKSRVRLINAAYELLATEGYQAISARRVADQAGLKSQLVHYYFRSMEELVVAVFQKSTARYYQLHDEALSSPSPLRALWKLNASLPEAQRMTEYLALGKQHPLLREEMRKAGENFRRLQIEVIEKVFAARGIDRPPMSAATLAMLMSAIARNFVIEGEVGMTVAHEDMQRLIDQMLDFYEPLSPVAASEAAGANRG